jgi:hypothetical protein
MEDEKFEQQRLNAWRGSDFYDWVIGILKEEIDADYVRESIVFRSKSEEPMSDLEIGQAMRAQVQAQLRIQAIKDRLE